MYVIIRDMTHVCHCKRHDSCRLRALDQTAPGSCSSSSSGSSSSGSSSSGGNGVFIVKH
jgi:hypothetical protein